MKAIGLDLDGCLYDWHTSIYNYYVQFHDYQGTWTKFWTNYKKDIGEEQMKYLASIDIFYSDIMPTPECIEFLDNIKDSFEIYYITSRPDLVKLTTEQYLNRYNFPQKENLIFEKDKVNKVRQLKIQYFLEDLPKHVEDLSKVTNVIMFARPWNRDIWDKYPTARSFQDVLRFMEA